jgi:hypothetical protein
MPGIFGYPNIAEELLTQKETRMKKSFIIVAGFITFGLEIHATQVDSLNFGFFGKVIVYMPSKVPDAVVLFVSGDGGWNEGVVEVQKIKSLHPVCIFGDEEDSELRDHFSATGAKIEILHGRHHNSNDFNAMSAIIFKDSSPD